MTKKIQSQVAKFKQVAREIGADESEASFNSSLMAVATAKPREARAVVHASDCAVNSMPAYAAGACTCGAVKAER